MKIAIAIDDGRTVSTHFGRASHYAVLTVEDAVVVNRELRDKFSSHGTVVQARHESESGPHGTGPDSDARHDQMAAAIADCSALICGGMGQGAYSRIAANGIRPIVTDLRGVDEAAIECAAGRIVDHSDLGFDRTGLSIDRENAPACTQELACVPASAAAEVHCEART